MSFLWTSIYVKDLEESLDFYKNIIGLKVDSRMDMGEDNAIVFLGDGQTKVELIYDSEKQDINIDESISLGFEVNSIEEKMEFIKNKGLKIHSGPFNPAPNIKFFFVLDPNGVKIQFVENIK